MEKVQNFGAIGHPGSVLRSLRADRGWTLSEVARRTGLTISTLSKLETGRMALSYNNMVRIATGLNVDIGVLFASKEPAAEIGNMETIPAGGRRSITRAGEYRIFENDNTIQHYAAADLLNKQLVPIIVDVKARSRKEFGNLLRHAGEEYVLVLEGAIELHSDVYAPVKLERGDSIYFDSNMAHGYIAATDGLCRMLSVCSTAEWGLAAASGVETELVESQPYLQIVRAV